MRDAVYYPEDDDEDDDRGARDDGATATAATATTTATATATIATTTGGDDAGDGKARATLGAGTREGGGSYTTPGVAPPVMPTRLVSARTYESEPARGTPVGANGTRPPTIISTQNGVFAFATPMFADMDDPRVRAAMEREFARELGSPESELPVDLEQFVLARQLSRVVRLFALIDMVLCVLYALSGVSVIAVLLIGPLAGFVGARMYNPGLTACYVAFCVVSIIWKMLNFIFIEDVTARVLSVITIILATYITRLVIRFYHVVRSIPFEGQILLRQLDFANTAPVV